MVIEDTQLLVGGPRDGTRTACPPEVQTIQLPDVQTEVVNAETGERRVHWYKSEYVREYIITGESCFAFWRFVSLGREEAVRRLFTQYGTQVDCSAKD